MDSFVSVSRGRRSAVVVFGEMNWCVIRHALKVKTQFQVIIEFKWWLLFYGHIDHLHRCRCRCRRRCGCHCVADINSSTHSWILTQYQTKPNHCKFAANKLYRCTEFISRNANFSIARVKFARNSQSFWLYSRDFIDLKTTPEVICLTLVKHRKINLFSLEFFGIKDLQSSSKRDTNKYLLIFIACCTSAF